MISCCVVNLLLLVGDQQTPPVHHCPWLPAERLVRRAAAEYYSILFHQFQTLDWLIISYNSEDLQNMEWSTSPSALSPLSPASVNHDCYLPRYNGKTTSPQEEHCQSRNYIILHSYKFAKNNPQVTPILQSKRTIDLHIWSQDDRIPSLFKPSLEGSNPTIFPAAEESILHFAEEFKLRRYSS